MPVFYTLEDLQTILDKKFYSKKQAKTIARILDRLKQQAIEIPPALLANAQTWVAKKGQVKAKDLQLGNQISILFIDPQRGYYVGYIIETTDKNIKLFYPADKTFSEHAREEIIFEFISDRPYKDETFHDPKSKCTYHIPADPNQNITIELADAPAAAASSGLTEHADDEAEIITGLKRLADQYNDAANKLEQRRDKRSKVGQNVLDIMIELPALLKICSTWQVDLVKLLQEFQETDRCFPVLIEMFQEYKQMFPNAEKTLEDFKQQIQELYVQASTNTKDLERILRVLEPPAQQLLNITTTSSSAGVPASGLFASYNPSRGDDRLRTTIYELDKVMEPEAKIHSLASTPDLVT